MAVSAAPGTERQPRVCFWPIADSISELLFLSGMDVPTDEGSFPAPAQIKKH